MLAEVVTLYSENASSIPAMLRKSADAIETESAEGFDPTRAMIAVQISEGGQIQIYGWGNTDSMHALATLQRGIHWMLNDMAARTEP